MRYFHRALLCVSITGVLAGSLVLPVQTGNAQDLRFEHITTANGLSSSSVNAITQDHEGFMWFGTQDADIEQVCYIFVYKI